MNHPEKLLFLGRLKNISGKRIRETRLCTLVEGRKLSQADLAELVNRRGVPMNRVTLGRIENGDRSVSDVELLAIARALGVDIRSLLFDRPDRNVDALSAVRSEVLRKAS